MGRKTRPNSRLIVAASFAVGFLIATLAGQKKPPAASATASSAKATVPACKPCKCGGSKRDTLWAVSQAEQLEQSSFCKANEHPPSQSQLQTAGFSYVRHDGIQPGLGAAGFNMSMWVYDGTDIVSNAIRSSGMWESHETSEIIGKLAFAEQDTQLAREDLFFVDIGANVGWFTINAAALGFSVVAFEPTTPNAYAIRHTACGFPLMQRYLALVNKGLSDRPEKCSVIASKENLGDGHVQCNRNAADEPPPGMVVHGEFELTTLDTYFKDSMDALQDRVAVVKVDVEGFEDKVFKGADQFMKKIRPKFILCEFHGTFSQGTTAEEMLNMFHDWGYTVHTDRFDGPVEPPSSFSTLAERSGANAGAINLYFSRA